jgi:hypothetical protein
MLTVLGFGLGLFLLAAAVTTVIVVFGAAWASPGVFFGTIVVFVAVGWVWAKLDEITRS